MYITAILRDQFNLFFRFGYTYIPNFTLHKVTDSLEQTIKTIFSELTPFYDDSHYVLIELDNYEKKEDNSNIRFEIQDLKKIYPLSKLAAATIKQSRIDSRIILEEPVFEHLLYEIGNIHREKSINQAINALWSIYEIEGSPEPIIEKIGFSNILKGIENRKKGVKANMIETGNYWEYLLAYDRYDYFPDTTLGFFYDAGQVFAYNNNQSSFIGSKYHGFLESLSKSNPHINLKKIIPEIKSSDATRGYIDKTSVDGLERFIVSPIYLMLKEELRKEDDLKKTKLNRIDYLLEVGGENTKAALILLAAFFGFDKFYDAYYDTLDLRFFKKEVKSDKPVGSKQEKELPIKGETKSLKKKTSSKDFENSSSKDFEDSSTNKEKIKNDANTKVKEESSIEEDQKVEGKVKEEVSNVSQNPIEEKIHEKDSIESTDLSNVKNSLKETSESSNLKDNDELDDITNHLLNLIKTKGPLSITELSKELKQIIKSKKPNFFIENILKDRDEVEIYKEKNSNKVKMKKQASLFN